jgi:oxygen-independent coproporphyrinogen-3 oxidase
MRARHAQRIQAPNHQKIGVTRLSLGVEHFDDEILSSNGRAHKSPEIFRAWDWIRNVGFPQVNIDLIAGMLGETEDKWKYAVEQAIKLDPDSVTIYQMEVPFNTTIAREAKAAGGVSPVASWAQKRAWVDYAFKQFEAHGYKVSSAYTLVKPRAPRRLRLSRFALARRRPGRHRRRVLRPFPGRPLSERRHLGTIHRKNRPGELPLNRALPITDHQKLIREMILQLKTGQITAKYFRNKFGEDIRQEFRPPVLFARRRRFRPDPGRRHFLTREGLLRIDSLLQPLFRTEFQNIRYT